MSKKRTSTLKKNFKERLKQSCINMDICVDCGYVIIDLHEGATQCKECVLLGVRTSCDRVNKLFKDDE